MTSGQGSTLTVFSTPGLNMSLTIFPTTTGPRPSYSDAPDTIPVAGKIIIGTLITVGILFGVFGNILVSLAILRDKRLRKHNGNLMILNLAVTDLLMAILPMPIIGFHFVLYWPNWTFGETLCNITTYVTILSALVSLLTMVLIAFDRYFTVLRNKRMLKRRNVKIALSLLWIFSAAAFLQPRIANKSISKHSFKHGDWNVCARMDSKVIFDKGYKNSSVGQLIIGVLIQFALLLIYVRMGFFVWKNRRKGHDSERKRANKNIRALKLMFAIVLTFYICWFPYQVVSFLRIFPIPSDNLYVDPTGMLIAYSLAMFNSSVNPVLYALVSQKFRVAYRDIFWLAGRHPSQSFRSETTTSQSNPEAPVKSGEKSFAVSAL